MINHKHNDNGHEPHEHTHGVIDPGIASTRQGIKAIKWSFALLFITAMLQVAVVLYTGSVALLADTIHNIGDALTAVPLWIAFTMLKKKPSKQFTYGYGRVEDLAGVFIVLVILASAVIAGYESIDRIMHPRPLQNMWAVIAASIIGFTGNEAVALLRIKTGRKMGSAALVADGYHARIDGLTSLAVLLGAIGVWFGFELADPIIGLMITLVIMQIVYESGKMIFSRLIDGVDPHVIEEIRHAVGHVEGVRDISEVRARWLGHQLVAELNIAVDSRLNVEKGHHIAVQVREQLLGHLKYLSNAVIHVDPEHASGERYHSAGN